MDVARLRALTKKQKRPMKHDCFTGLFVVRIGNHMDKENTPSDGGVQHLLWGYSAVR